MQFLAFEPRTSPRREGVSTTTQLTSRVWLLRNLNSGHVFFLLGWTSIKLFQSTHLVGLKTRWLDTSIDEVEDIDIRILTHNNNEANTGLENSQPRLILGWSFFYLGLPRLSFSYLSSTFRSLLHTHGGLWIAFGCLLGPHTSFARQNTRLIKM